MWLLIFVNTLTPFLHQSAITSLGEYDTQKICEQMAERIKNNVNNNAVKYQHYCIEEPHNATDERY